MSVVVTGPSLLLLQCWVMLGCGCHLPGTRRWQGCGGSRGLQRMQGKDPAKALPRSGVSGWAAGVQPSLGSWNCGIFRLEKPSETTESNCSPGTAKAMSPSATSTGGMCWCYDPAVKSCPVTSGHLSPTASLIPGIFSRMDQVCPPPVTSLFFHPPSSIPCARAGFPWCVLRLDLSLCWADPIPG